MYHVLLFLSSSERLTCAFSCMFLLLALVLFNCIHQDQHFLGFLLSSSTPKRCNSHTAKTQLSTTCSTLKCLTLSVFQVSLFSFNFLFIWFLPRLFCGLNKKGWTTQNWYSTQIFTQPHVGTPCGKVLPPNLYYQRRTKCTFETWKQLGGFKSTWDVEPLQYWYVLRCPAKETDLDTETSVCEWRWKSWTNWGQNDFKEVANWGRVAEVGGLSGSAK